MMYGEERQLARRLYSLWIEDLIQSGNKALAEIMQHYAELEIYEARGRASLARDEIKIILTKELYKEIEIKWEFQSSLKTHLSLCGQRHHIGISTLNISITPKEKRKYSAYEGLYGSLPEVCDLLQEAGTGGINLDRCGEAIHNYFKDSDELIKKVALKEGMLLATHKRLLFFGEYSLRSKVQLDLPYRDMHAVEYSDRAFSRHSGTLTIHPRQGETIIFDALDKRDARDLAEYVQWCIAH